MLSLDKYSKKLQRRGLSPKDADKVAEKIVNLAYLMVDKFIAEMEIQNQKLSISHKSD